jgi:malate dehydrogenase
MQISSFLKAQNPPQKSEIISQGLLRWECVKRLFFKGTHTLLCSFLSPFVCGSSQGRAAYCPATPKTWFFLKITAQKYKKSTLFLYPHLNKQKRIMSKVTVVGAGNVGATVANVLAHKDLVKEIVLLDIQGNMAKGKALDSWQQAPVDNYSTFLRGTDNYEDTANSDIVVITAGVPRKPGMSRDDLISINAKIVTSVTESILKYSPNPILISNPLDVMTYAAYKKAGLPSSRVFGMAGILDTARYRAFLAEALQTTPKDIQAVLMGGHGDTMVPLPRYTTVAGIPVTELIDTDALNAIVERTKTGGGELVNLMGTSAWYAPGAAAAQMVEAIVRDENRIFPCCALVNGEYGLRDMFIGVPVKLGKNGIEQILELKLNADEMDLLHGSAKAVKAVMDVYDNMGM